MFRGMIIFWHGTVALIPHDWHLCNGDAGTPDLLRHIPIGAGGAYNVGDNAHAFIHSHTAPNSHFHAMVAGSDIDYASGKLFITQTASPTIVSDYADHHPPFYALLPIMKL